VGTGQVVDTRESERLGYEETLKEARAAHNAEAIQDLVALAPYPGASGPISFDKTIKERKWLVHFGGYTWRNTNDHSEDLMRLSPDYTDADVKGYEEGDEKSPRVIWDEFSEVNFWRRNVFRCPVVLFQGSHDLNVSHELVARWLPRCRRPRRSWCGSLTPATW
jgi:hypothetical protein